MPSWFRSGAVAAWQGRCKVFVFRANQSNRFGYQHTTISSKSNVWLLDVNRAYAMINCGRRPHFIISVYLLSKFLNDSISNKIIRGKTIFTDVKVIKYIRRFIFINYSTAIELKHRERFWPTNAIINRITPHNIKIPKLQFFYTLNVIINENIE